MTRQGIGCHAAGERLPRHRHAEGYIAVVLAGGFEEAGDDGRFTARAGTAVVHGLYERIRTGSKRAARACSTCRRSPG